MSGVNNKVEEIDKILHALIETYCPDLRDDINTDYYPYVCAAVDLQNLVTQQCIEAQISALQEQQSELWAYKMLFGEIKPKYGKVDTLLALKNYDKKQSFRDNFERYLEKLKAKMEATDLAYENLSLTKASSEALRSKDAGV